jgi:hypothetical protein
MSAYVSGWSKPASAITCLPMLSAVSIASCRNRSALP